MRNRGLKFLLTLLAPVWVSLFAVCACGAAPDPPTEISESPEEPQQQQQRRQTTFTAGVLLLIGVTTIGLLLIAAAIIWGAKVRRLVRRPDPPFSAPDQLWYLRKSAGPPPAAPADEPSGSE